MACRQSHAKHIDPLIHIPHNQYKKNTQPVLWGARVV